MYVELHCHSSFSLLDGASSPEALAARAAALHMPALALTDHDALYAAPRFIRAAREHGLRPILGAELALQGGSHLTLLVENEAGWHNLCYLISRAQAGAEKGKAALPAAELEGCTDGLIALSGCPRGEIPAALKRGQRRQVLDAARRYRDLFGPDHFWIELQRHFLPGEERLVRQLAGLARYLGLGCVATNNVHYAARDGHRLQDVLVCIRHNTTLDQATHLCRLNSEYYLKSPPEMAALFPDHPQALANTLRLAERCSFELRYGLQDLPRYETPDGMSSEAYLRRLCRQGLRERYGEPPARARDQLQRELDVIGRAGLANYFLIVWDIVRHARENNIRCQGRGSAAGSLVAYLLHVSPVDPLVHDLVFERFLSEERLSAGDAFMPDVDVDFDAARREEVIQYVYRRYGQAHVAMACTFSTFRRKSALRDVSKALGLSPAVVAVAGRALETEEAAPRLPDQAAQTSLELLLDLCRQIEGFPRHLGIHSGGMIITGAPLVGRVPTEPAALENRVVTQWDKEGLEEAGLVKIDVLGLRMLSAIGDAVELVRETAGVSPELPAIRPGVHLEGLDLAETAVYQEAEHLEALVYEMLCQADTLGVFQVESRAQAQMLPRLRPRSFEDIVVAISLIRPGPIQGNMVHPYLRRRLGLEPVSYAHPLLEPALKETLGVILFQEQVLKVARDLAGFTPGQGEQLRRALGAKRATEAIDRLRGDFLAGARANGVPPDVAETVFEQLRAFGGYSFAKSHAAAFAVLVYQSAWLKRYHFLPFMAALLNNQPMGFWTPAVLLGEVRRKGYAVLPVDVHRSQARCTVEDGALRLGFNYVGGLGEAHVERLVVQRRRASFPSLADFWQRARPGRRAAESLILAGAFDAWGLPRRQLLWELGTLREQPGAPGLEPAPQAVALPELTPAEALLAEQAALGLSAGEHVMVHVRPRLARNVLSTVRLAACRDGQRVRLAGLLVVHQSPPSAKGFHFLTLEDETGLIDVVVQPQVYDRYRAALHAARLLLVEGVVQQEGNAVNVLARRIAPLPSSTNS